MPANGRWDLIRCLKGGALRYTADMQSGMYSTGGPLRD